MSKAGDSILQGLQDALDYTRGDKSKGREHKVFKPIETEEEHKTCLKRIEEIFFAKPNTPEGDELEILSKLASDYEDKKHSPKLENR